MTVSVKPQKRIYWRKRLRIKALFVPLDTTPRNDLPVCGDFRMECVTTNISASGALVESPYAIPESAFLLVNLALDDLDMPHTIVAHTRWIEKKDSSGGTRCGLKFLTREDLEQALPNRFPLAIPFEAMQFDRLRQQQLDRYLDDMAGTKPAAPSLATLN